MGSSQGQSDSNNANSKNQSKLFERHPIKMLNFGLILYLSLGAFLFDSLGEFQEPLKGDESKKIQGNSNSNGDGKSSVELSELRLKSVRRMWNITNQLNILYESNWTQLVLDELVEFERQFIESLVESEQTTFSSSDVEADAEERKSNSNNKDESEKSKNSGSSNSSKSRGRSIKKSLIHSLATITTIGSPLANLRSNWGKFATVLYGAIGIPLLFCTIAQTGKQLAKSATNTLLVTKHYCISLPLHYLCCSFSPKQCFRWLSWCCCCCCCSYLCCFSDKDKRKCCDKSRRPKLRLVKGGQKRRGKTAATSAAGSSKSRSNQSRVAYVIGDNNNTSSLPNGSQQQQHFKQDNFGTSCQQQKSVRFSNHQQQQQEQQNKPEVELTRQFEDEGNGEQEMEDSSSLKSPGLFLTSLIILTLYLTFGAFMYSHWQNVPLVDSVFICYELLSVSRLPTSFNLEPKHKQRESISDIYQSFKASNKTEKLQQIIEETSSDLFEVESIAWQTFYLICGLYLVSMCTQFAQFWLEDNFNFLDDDDDDDNQQSKENLKPLCNGFTAPFDGQQFDGSFANCCPQIEYQTPSAPKGAPETQYLVQALMAHTQPETQIVPHNIQQQQQQQQQQIDLAELFVVSQETSPIGLQYSSNQPQQHKQIASESSFASDRSTERNSLCQLHQVANTSLVGVGSGVAAVGAAGAIYGTQQPTYGGRRQQMALRTRKDHLYLPNQCVDGGSLRRQLGDEEEEEEEEGEEDDDYEMDRMIKTCLNGTNQRSSSSSIQLSHSNGYLSSNNTVEGFGQHPSNNIKPNLVESSSSTARSSLGRREIRLLEPNGCEQDNSLNTIDTTTTNSNTISSVSSRTVKLPQHIHIHNGIGFIIDPNINDENNKQ